MTTDHLGADWTPVNGSEISGEHTNVGTFTITAGYTVNIDQYDGGADSGWVKVNGVNILVAGILNGYARGYSGGNGGAGGLGGDGYGDYPHAGSNGSVGGGAYGGAGGAGAVARPNVLDGLNGLNGAGGARGGYNTTGGNNDTSTTETVNIGSGAGGAGGGGGGQIGGSNDAGGGGGGGGAGARGGASCHLTATTSLIISGDILCTGSSSAGNGSVGGTATSRWVSGSGGAGGSASSAGSRAGASGGGGYRSGGDGGAGASSNYGAGGGCFLKCTTTSGINLTGSTIDLRGGASVTANGGSLKIFYVTTYTVGTTYVGKTIPVSVLPTATGYIGVGGKDSKLRLVASADAEYAELKINLNGTTYSADLVNDNTLYPVKVHTQNGTLAWRDGSAE